MEAIAVSRGTPSTGSKTIADLAARAAESWGSGSAVRFKRDGAWHDVTFVEVAAIVSEIARGLLALGVEAGDRVAILAATRPEWTYCDLAIAAAGAVAVPIYPTNAPPECEWVAPDSRARIVVCENPVQLTKLEAVRERLPRLEHAVVIDGEAPAALALADLRERGRGVPEAQLRERTEAVRPKDPFTFIYTSGTTGPPKGCVLTHGNYRSVLDSCEKMELLEPQEVAYLYLPLAHSYALLIQLLWFDLGGTLAYWGGEIAGIIPELAEVQPTYLPSVPRLFEKLYALVTAHADPAELRQAIAVGLEVRAREARGEPVPPELRAGFERADERLFSKVRAAFGGRLKRAVTGAAPIAPEILEFFSACGVPVLEGYGMTETATVATASTLEHHRFGTVGRALPGVELRIAEDGELLIKGPNVFAGYHGDAEQSFGAVEHGWLHTGDLGSIDEDGYVRITGRIKDIIITAGGKNITPANLENDLKQSRWISHALVHGDRRPYLVALITLDAEEIAPWAQQRGLPTDLASLAAHPQVRELIQGVVDAVNARYAPSEQIKRFAILDHDFGQETGELTPTLKLKRTVVRERYAGLLDELYA